MDSKWDEKNCAKMLFFSNFSWRSLIIFTICLHLSKAHMRMVCPRPVSPRSDISTPPMNIGQKECRIKDELEQNVLEVHPGLFTLRFEETKFMAGSPFRVVLFTSSSAKEHIFDFAHEKRGLKRERRDVSETATGGSISLQALKEIMNGTLDTFSEITKSLNDSVPNNTVSQGIGNNISDKDENSNGTDHTEIPAKFESTTASNIPVMSTGRLPKENTSQAPDDTPSDSDTDGDKNHSSDNVSSQSCVLLDHIPHNDQAVISCSDKESNAYPLGVCDESTYYVTIRIPDVFCPDCFLVVQQIEARPDHKICDVSAVNESECVSYISCARISIRPSSEGMDRNLSDCSNYVDNLPDDWAYRPQDLYKTGDEAHLTMDVLHGDLHIEIMRGLKIGPIEKVEIRHNRDIIWNGPRNDGHLNADSLMVVWTNIPGKYRTLLKANKLVLNLIGSKKSLALDITFRKQIFSEGKLSYLHDIYSTHGWLIAERYLGPSATDPMAALPIGSCAPPARHFLALFDANNGKDHGLLGMSILENRAYITAVLRVFLGTVQSIRFKGSQLIGAKDIVVTVPDSFSGVFQVALDVTQQVKYLDTVQFLKTVEVNTNRENAIMIGDLEEGIYTVLRDHMGQAMGMGAFQPTQGYWMRAEILLSDLSDPEVKSAKLLGSHVELMDLSKHSIHCTKQFCFMDNYFTELSTKFFLHLLSGQARVEVRTNMDVVSGQIVGSNVGSNDCTRHEDLCLISERIERKKGVKNTLQLTTVNAMMFLNRAEVLEVSVQLDRPYWNISVNGSAAHLMIEDGPTIKVPLFFLWISEEQYTAEERFPFSRKLMMMLDKKIHLKITSDDHTLISNRIISLRQRECILPKYHLVGQGRHFWSAPFDVLYAVVRDHIKFIYDNTTSFYLMPSKESFQKCDFSEAKELKKSTSPIEGLVNYYSLTSPGRFYFADKGSCSSSAPAKLIAQVVRGQTDEGSILDRNKEKWCQTSFYMAWRQDQLDLDKWYPPSVGGPVVLGLFLGIITGIGFLLWQGMKMKHMQSHSASASRNSLSHFVRF